MVEIEKELIIMLLNLMDILDLIYMYSWFVWPFVLFFSLGVALERIVKGEKGFPIAQLVVASVALTVILAAIVNCLNASFITPVQ